MDVKQIRLNNLRTLIKETGTIAELARRSDTAPAYLSQILNMLPAKSGSPRTIGDRLARKLETANLKPYGWMDCFHEGELKNINAEEGRVPLYESGALMRHLSGERVKCSKNLTVPFRLSEQAYALHVEGDAMFPRFQAGDIIIAEPSTPVIDEDFVIALIQHADRPTFAQYREEGAQRQLTLLNPQYPAINIGQQDIIIDKIIYRGERF